MLSLPINSPSIITLAHLVTGQLPPATVPEEHWAELISLALDHGLGGMLLWTLHQAGWEGIGEPYFQPLVASARRNGRYSLLLEKARWQAAMAFDQAAIPAIWLKGIALAHTHYPEPHLRHMVDLDVLVPAIRLETAREALLAEGFRLEEVDFFELGGFTNQGRQHECLLDRTGQVKLELHFRLLIPALHDRLEEGHLDWFWAQTQELAPAGPSFRVLKPEANLLHLCAHAILQNQGEPLDLLHLLDLHLLVTQSQLDWDLVVERAAALHWTYAVERALSLLPALFDTRLAEGVLEALQERRPAGEPSPVTIVPQHSVRRWEEWRSAFGRMSTPQRLRLVWLTLFPPGRFLRQQYSLSPGQSLLPYYVSHLLDGGQEAARALWVFLRRPGIPHDSE